MPGSSPVQRIYISSTYKDLIDERQAASKSVRVWNHHARGMEDYCASDSRPLDKCIADVKSCDAYIGILGWRYGFIPQGQTKSITELEYEAAGEAGLPRLMFLSPDRDQWTKASDSDAADLQRIEALRRRAGEEQTAGFFSDAKDLRTAVSESVGARFGKAEAINYLVPYLCDRVPQVGRLQQLVQDCSSELREKPFLCLMPGEYQQAHEKMIDCLKERFIPNWLGGDHAVQSFRIRWPVQASASFADDLGFQLRSEILPHGGSLEEVARWLSDLRSPVLLYTRFPVEKWDAHSSSLLDAFARFWIEWPHCLRCFPALVILYVEFAAQAGWLAKLLGREVRRNEQIRAALADLQTSYGPSGRFILLPELPNVEYNDIREWSDSEEVERICGKGTLESVVVEHFNERVALPMEPLAKELKELLERHHQRA